MFSHVIAPNLRMELVHPTHARELFELTDRNREHLREWLPWLDHTLAVKDTRAFLRARLDAFSQHKGMDAALRYDDQIVGMVGLNSIDHAAQSGAIGYWLGQPFTGRGIMTRAVEALMQLATTYHGLQRFEIRCATGNLKSRAIPERLGFVHEGTLRRRENLYGRWVDHEVYAHLLTP